MVELNIFLPFGIDVMASSLRVMVIEESRSSARYLRDILNQNGFNNIIETIDSSEALKKLLNNKFDLVICELTVPPMGGLALLTQIRADEELHALPFIMIARDGAADIVIEAISAGVTAYIVKPFTMATLKSRIMRIIDNLK